MYSPFEGLFRFLVPVIVPDNCGIVTTIAVVDVRSKCYCFTIQVKVADKNTNGHEKS